MNDCLPTIILSVPIAVSGIVWALQKEPGERIVEGSKSLVLTNCDIQSLKDWKMPRVAIKRSA